MENTKGLLSSKTFWFGALQVIFGAIGYLFGFIDGAQASTLVVTGLGTIGLRTATNKPVDGL